MDLLQGIVPVRLVIMPSTSWNRLFRCFEDCRVEVEGILVDTVFGEGDRLGVDVSEFSEALSVCLLVVSAGGAFFLHWCWPAWQGSGLQVCGH